MPAKSLLLLFVEKADLLIFVNFLFLRKNGNSTTVGDVATLIFTVPNSTKLFTCDEAAAKKEQVSKKKRKTTNRCEKSQPKCLGIEQGFLIQNSGL